MASILRFDSAQTVEGRRWVVGLHVSSDCRRVSSAAVAAVGRGLDVRLHIAGGVTVPVPAEIGGRFDEVAGEIGRGDSLPDQMAAIKSGLVEVQAAAVGELLSRANLPAGRVLAVGVLDPSLWSTERGGLRDYWELGDAARLAESTGLNVVDAFAARDLARGGLGGPLTAVPEWLLLRSVQRNQVLVDLGRTTRLTWLPAGTGNSSAARIMSFDVGPGTGLLDLLTQRLSGGKQPFDHGGRLGVQGRRLTELVDSWLASPYFETPLPRWNPGGVDARAFFHDAMEKAIDAGWSVRDMLCSAAHFLAEATVRTIQRFLPESCLSGPILVCGGGQHNGMLLREIGVRLPRAELVRVSEMGIASEALDAASAGILALLHLDQVPANPPSVTGTDLCRVLGRLTPGSPQNWQRLLNDLTGSTPAVRPLRSAL
ncbi:MAG: anhydro-N-acetylmuramic acid kinase [Pirellulales bacterium]|nr:anhydro-N-acetylmuramic acid kinase [Pirellulales bacterium]